MSIKGRYVYAAIEVQNTNEIKKYLGDFLDFSIIFKAVTLSIGRIAEADMKDY